MIIKSIKKYFLIYQIKNNKITIIVKKDMIARKFKKLLKFQGQVNKDVQKVLSKQDNIVFFFLSILPKIKILFKN